VRMCRPASLGGQRVGDEDEGEGEGVAADDGPGALAEIAPVPLWGQSGALRGRATRPVNHTHSKRM